MSTPTPTTTLPPNRQPAPRRPSSHAQPQPQPRQHPTHPAAKPRLHIHPTSTLADTAHLTGTHPITLAARTIIHPRAKLVSTHAAIELGEGCIVCERASVGYLSAASTRSTEPGDGDGNDDTDREGEGAVRLGRGVVIEAGAIVEAREVGEGTVVEVGARVGRGCVVGKHCKIAPLAAIAPYESVPDYTVVFGAGRGQRRRVDGSGFAEARMRVGERHVDVLRGLVASGGARGQ